jgi:predicted PhzF superfamily epimerase YddE/YHI9
MQRMAAELRQPETAFVWPDHHGWTIRWFSPVTEVELCGHATLAAASAIWASGAATPDRIVFNFAGGVLSAMRDAPLIWLDFPVIPGIPARAPPEVAACAGVPWVASARHGERWLLECSEAETVRSARPDVARLRATGIRSLVLTARSDVAGFDIVSRNFAPLVGVDEDQATGSAHACLAPYWADRLGPELVCWQASARGGVIHTRLSQESLLLGGQAQIEQILTAGGSIVDSRRLLRPDDEVQGAASGGAANLQDFLPNREGQ